MERKKKCEHKNESWIRADELDETVIRYLFECFGNPLAIQKAIEAATPNRAKSQELQKRKVRITDELSKLERGRGRILNLITKEKITEKQAEKELDSIKQKELALQSEQDIINDSLANMPDASRIKVVSKKVSEQFVSRYKYSNSKLILTKRYINHSYNEMTDEEKRALVKLVFSGMTLDGKRMGVFIKWDEAGNWRFSIHGHLMEETGLLPLSERQRNIFFDFENNGGGYKQRELMSSTKSTLYYRAQSLL